MRVRAVFKPNKTYIGIDNGVTGTIGIITENGEYFFYHVPVFKEQDYTKSKKIISRVDIVELTQILSSVSIGLVLIERPMINAMRFKASVSAARCLEATLIALKDVGHSFQFCDSKNWQSVLLPRGLKSEELKKASLDIGKRLFPKIEWKGFKDADGILIAEWARRKAL